LIRLKFAFSANVIDVVNFSVVPAQAMSESPVTTSIATLTDFDLHLWSEGTHVRAYEKLGAHPLVVDGTAGTQFVVWAPDAEAISVIGDFNGWTVGANPMTPVQSSGLWRTFVPNVGDGATYKYAIRSRYNGYSVNKADPFGFYAEMRPSQASKVFDIAGYGWGDADWMANRAAANAINSPIAIYELHLGSWKRSPEEGNRWLTYREVAPLLADYCRQMGYTHVELLPITEHPFDGSWGYQTVGYFAPTSRFGTPHDFMFLVDTLHQAGIGVILDWVPAHFPKDEHGLGYFDGTHLFEHADPRQGEQQDWGTFIFNFGRKEVVNFLISNALFWLDKYHIDGLRVDAVASMLYLDYSRKDGEWTPNRYGGRENLEALEFLRRLNERVYGDYPDTITIAEESTAWPSVSRPLYLGGLGFGYKWDLGWMHDTLEYLKRDPIFRRYHHDQITFRMVYAFNENYLLPLSHDEVVHEKRSLLYRMPGDDWQRFANLRLLFGYQYALPGKKLLFMGGEIAQTAEWNYATSLDWHLLEYEPHQGIQRFVADLNAMYRRQPGLHERDCDPGGFEWIDSHNADASILAFFRRGHKDADDLVVVLNFTPVPREDYLIGVPRRGHWDEILNSDDAKYGGSGVGNGGVEAEPISWHGRPAALMKITVPPLAMVVFRHA
jgi:1,4-alpha-glucan branching enzyme